MRDLSEAHTSIPPFLLDTLEVGSFSDVARDELGGRHVSASLVKGPRRHSTAARTPARLIVALQPSGTDPPLDLSAPIAPLRLVIHSVALGSNHYRSTRIPLHRTSLYRGYRCGTAQLLGTAFGTKPAPFNLRKPFSARSSGAVLLSRPLSQHLVNRRSGVRDPSPACCTPGPLARTAGGAGLDRPTPPAALKP